MSSKRGSAAAAIGVVISSLFLCTTLHAAPDTFGLGDGHSGPLTIVGKQTVINTYAQSKQNVAAMATTLTLISAAGFQMNDLVLIWQSAGLAMPPVSGTQTLLDLAGSPAGHFEFARVSAVDAMSNKLTFAAPLINAFDANATQVIRVPEYTTLTITANGSIVAQPWDGSTGGVVAFLATGAVQNDGSINADGAGFRGGVAVNDPKVEVGCGVSFDDAGPMGAQKGEGVAGSGSYGNFKTGNGNIGNGAGGGVCQSAGGGGGGHGGKGGKGGRTAANDASRDVGGLGGGPIKYSLVDRFTFGGGGGAGQGSNMTTTDGGRGGGAVFVRAASLAGTGTISADGSGLVATAMSDGGGGGGGGGGISLRISGAAVCGIVSARGGNGGSTGSMMLSYGPGGGGAGGRILLQAGSLNCPTRLDSGVGGVSFEKIVFGPNYGATPASPQDAVSKGIEEKLLGPGGYCATDGNCGGQTPHCLVAENRCVQCTTNTDCNGNTPVCGVANQCRACAADNDCGGATPACQLGGQNAGACGQCSLKNATKCSGTTPACEASTGLCRACASDVDCAGLTPACQLAGNFKGACATCSTMNTAACTAAAPACDPATATCVVCVLGGDVGACKTSADGKLCLALMNVGFCGCATDGDCGAATSGRVCDDKASRKCLDGCSGAANRNHCPAGLICNNTDASGATVGHCVKPCQNDGECPAASPFCVRDNTGSSTCVVCRTDGDCTKDPNKKVCFGENHSCVTCTVDHTDACHPEGSGSACLVSHTCGCTTDTQCGGNQSGRICDAIASACDVGCRGAGGNACPAGATCSSTTPMAGTCGIVADAGGGLIAPDGGTVGLTGGGACGIGRGHGTPGKGSGNLLGLALAALAFVWRGRRRVR